MEAASPPPSLVSPPKDDLVTAVGYSTVAIMRHNGDEHPTSLGSGTLVNLGNVFGVLTCAHAWHGMRASREIGLVCFTVRGRTPQYFPLDPQALTAVWSGDDKERSAWKWSEPDIAFFRLPPHAVAHCRALGFFRDLDRQWELLTSEAFRYAHRFAVGGIINGYLKEGELKAGRRTLNVSGFVSLGPIRRRLEFPNDFDQWIFAPKALPSTALPENFEGTSGGGLWRVHVEGQSLAVALAGVAHYQTRRRNIVCHGPRSLYARVGRAIRERWAVEFA